MGGHVKAERPHAARIIAHALERHAERRADQVLDEEISRERAGERQIVERHGIAQTDPKDRRRIHLVEAAMPREQGIVLQREIIEGDADRERDHDGIDALGAHREPADEGGECDGDQHGEDNREPPGPAQADRIDAGAEDRHHVAGDAGYRELCQRNHAATAAEESERERDQPKREGLAADLEGKEGRDDQWINQQAGQHDHMAEAHMTQGLDDIGPDAPRARSQPYRRRRCRRGTSERVAAGARVHRAAPLGRAHAGLPRMPRGRNASTSAMITNVNTMP